MINHFFLFCLLLGVIGCSSSTAENMQQDLKEEKQLGASLDSIIARGKLLAIVNNTPTSYFIYKGVPMGYQYDLLARFCRDLGVDLEIKVVPSIPNAVDSLKLLKADILASGLTVLGNRKKEIDFASPLTQTRQVLIQRKPYGSERWSKTKLDKHLLRDVTRLAGDTVYVEQGSAYVKRMYNLQEEIGDSIHIVTYDGEIDMDSIMTLISTGKVKYAVTDEYTAKFFLRYFPNLDTETPVSFNQNIAWAIPKNSNSLEDTLNAWINKNVHGQFGAVVYNKYFKHNKSMATKVKSSYNIENGKISPYDEIIKTEASKINWDWKLIAAQISVESGFEPQKTSWAGAQGLMQIMPATARGLTSNYTNIYDPHLNIRTGVKLNGILYNYWITEIPDSLEAIKFSLASYNIGKGHVFDAQRLATKYGLDPNRWDGHVADMIVKLSRSNYFRDNVVRHGYCRGIEAHNYVARIENLYGNYSNFTLADK